MISVTERAAKKVKEYLSRQKDMIGLRVSVKGGGCSGFTYHLDFESLSQPDDKELSSHDIKLFVDTKSYLYLMGVEIDYVDGLEGSGFKFNNPGAKRTCGCGESFSI